jgi:hypothetical protein
MTMLAAEAFQGLEWYYSQIQLGGTWAITLTLTSEVLVVYDGQHMSEAMRPWVLSLHNQGFWLRQFKGNFCLCWDLIKNHTLHWEETNQGYEVCIKTLQVIPIQQILRWFFLHHLIHRVLRNNRVTKKNLGVHLPFLFIYNKLDSVR